MSSGLDPVILQKLEAFSQRRRKLIILRGIFAAIAMLLATMMIVAAIDFQFVLPEWVRWTLSGIAYLTVIITEWRACLRLLVHAPDARALARLIEHAEPKLREDLISAVELGQSSSSFDSEQFRNLVQADVASRIEGLNMDRLLPVQLLRRTIVLASLVALACGGILAASGFQFGTLLMRAMLPMANLARVSKVKVKIVEPAPAEGVVPQGDAVPVVIEIGGQRTNKAVLETFTRNGGREVVPMTATGPDRFVATVQVAREDIEYRVKAGDALTRKHLLQAKPRPHVARFHKTYRYPDYVKQPENQLTEEHGDLAALEGTQVTLEVETDQAVKTAEIRMEQGKQSSTVNLTPGANGKLTASFPMQAAGYYRVHLVAAETSFENKFSPEYELKAEPDLVPQIELELPRADLILPSNEVVDIRGKASDDYGIAKIAQLIRVNEGEWKEVPLNHTAGKETSIERRWDLYEMGVKAGDLLTTKLVAVDLKGSRSESRAIRISVTSSSLESNRLTSLESQRQLVGALKKLRTAAETLEKRGRESNDQIARLAENDPQRKQALVSFTGALDDFERAAGGAVSQLQETLRTATPVHSTGEFVLLGRLLARMWAGTEQNARDAVTIAAVNETLPHVRDLVREAADATSRTVQRARQAEEGGRAFVTSTALEVLNENVQVIAREQDRISELVQNSGDDAGKWAQITTRLRVVLSQMQPIGEMINATSEYATNGIDDRLRRYMKEFDKHRALAERAVGQEGVSKEKTEAIRKFSKEMNEFRRFAFDLRRDYLNQPARFYQSMVHEVQPSWMNFEKTKNDVETIFRNERVPLQDRVVLMNARWEAKISLFKAHGDAEEARPDSDAYFVSDVRATTLAMNGFREPMLGGEKPFAQEDKKKAFEALDKAFRVLENAHNLAEVHDGLTRLATAERWEVSALRARASNPYDWEWLEARLRVLPEELGRTQIREEPFRGILNAAQKILSEARGNQAWRTVNEEMKQRMRLEATPRAVPEDVERVAAFVKQALDLLREPVREARELIAQMAPKLSEMMDQLAKKAEKLRQETALQASKTAEKSPDQIQADAKRQLVEQQDLSRELEAVRDALRSDANKQDMLEEEGRERARDADDALAMLKDPPPKAEEALAEAAAKTEGADQQPLLESAATEQRKLADALKQLSEHYEALEQGNSRESRVALRENEKALGIKESMDQRFARAEELSQMAKSTPEEMIKQLEKALPQNPLMQQELSNIAKNTLNAASEKLADASQKESSVAEQVKKLAAEQQAQMQALAQQKAQEQALAQQRMAQAQAQQNAAQASPNQPQAQTAAQQNPAPDAPAMAANQQDPQSPPDANAAAQQAAQAQSQMAQNQPGNQANQQAMANGQNQQQQGTQQAPQNPQLAQAANQQAPIAQAAKESGADVARAGRHEQRLKNTAVGQQLEKLGEGIQETGNKEIADAQKALENTQIAEQAQGAVNAAQEELKRELTQLGQAQSGQMPGQQNSPEQGQQPAENAQGQAGQQMQAQNGQLSPSSPQSGQASEASSQNGQQQAASQPQQGQMAQAAQPNPGEGSQKTPHPPYEPGIPPWQQPAMFIPPNASPQEQVWMARTLDALDTAMHMDGSQQEGQSGKQAQSQSGNQQGQGQQQQQQNGQQSADAKAKAQQAMSQAAQAATAAVRASRSQENKNQQQPSSSIARGELQARSQNGALADGSDQRSGALPGLQGPNRTGDWGKLPKKVAEQLSQGQRETMAGEYRNQVETYYRVIAERAKKQ